MSLAPDEKQRILKLASGDLPPETGMEKHFLMVLGGKGRACSPKEKEWYAYWRNQPDSSLTSPATHSQQPAGSPRPSTSGQPGLPGGYTPQSASASILGEFDTPADTAFEDEVVFEEVRQKLNLLLSKPKSGQPFVQQLGHIREALTTARAALPHDIAKQLQVAEAEIAPF